MKKLINIFYILMLVSPFVFSSCKHDDILGEVRDNGARLDSCLTGIHDLKDLLADFETKVLAQEEGQTELLENFALSIMFIKNNLESIKDNQEEHEDLIELLTASTNSLSSNIDDLFDNLMTLMNGNYDRLSEIIGASVDSIASNGDMIDNFGNIIGNFQTVVSEELEVIRSMVENSNGDFSVTKEAIDRLLELIPEPSAPVAVGALFSKFSVSSSLEDSIIEESKRVKLAEVNFVLGDGSFAFLDRYDVIFNYVGTETDNAVNPWDVFDKVYLERNGVAFAEIDADDEDSYGIRGGISASGVKNLLRMFDINQRFDAGELHSFDVTVDISESIDFGSNSNANWELTFDKSSLRFVDSLGTQFYFLSESNSQNIDLDFTVSEADNQILVSKSVNNPVTDTLVVHSDDVSDPYQIATFNVASGAKSQELDIRAIELSVQTTHLTSPVNVENVVFDLELRVNGIRITSSEFKYSNGGNSPDVSVSFEDITNVSIPTGSNIEIELWAEIKGFVGNYVTGSQTDGDDRKIRISANVTAANVDRWSVEGGDDSLTIGELKGSVSEKILRFLEEQ